jgi:tungstate transport system ATP-binding protein
VTLYAISSLTKAYGNRTVLDIPSVDLEQECIYALLGPNGAGKTTLLNILGFLERPTTGQVRYLSKEVRYSESDLQRLRKRVVLLDQHPILFTTSVRKNIEFGLKIRKISRKRRDHIINECLDLVGMRDYINVPAQHLSGGETQRIAIARALAVSPAVFLCDEPTASVDVENRNIIISILKNINRTRKISIIFTTHDRFQAARLAHYTIVLNHGRLVPTLYENIFNGILQSGDNGQLQCAIQDKIYLPIAKRQVKNNRDRASVFIDPEKIEIIGPSEASQIQNKLQGRVVQIIEENGKIRVVVDAGVWIAVLITNDCYREIRPLVGENINFSIPPGAVQIF